MDRGEVWESGTPKQIFEDPERKEPRDFILRIRNWNWEIRSLDHDYVAMSSSLQEFCARQFLDQRMSLKCQLAVEEITSSFLIPVAREHGITDPEISYQLSVGERREEADLVVSLDKYKASGIEADTIIETADDISKQLLDSVVKRTFEDENGQYHFIIG